ncbi:MAG: NAD-dependent epimerase/dehydratase family protein [Proteobacteria bacterium]|nr:NAD-dependent epimerase/dehydratase family protein [Pseudomonadota bacterium]
MLKVNKVFLVTGATGYLAANFLNFIQASRPDFFEAYDQIFLFDRHLKLSRLDLGILENKKIKKIAFDLSQVEEFTCSLESLLISAKSDSLTLGKGLDETSVFNLEILHFASLNNLELEKLFIKGFQEFALKTNSLIKFIYLSSSAVYGENDSEPLIPSDENDFLKPISAYGIYKMQIEKFIQELFLKCFLIIRLANPYGGEFECRGVYQNFKQQLINTAMDENFTVKINAEAERQIVRDFVNIRDFCFMLIGLIEANACGIYNVASEKVTYLEDFAESVKNDLLNNSLLDLSLSQKKIHIEYQGFKPADIKVSHLSARKLRDCLQAHISA